MPTAAPAVAATPRSRPQYENYRPPVIGVQLFVPVGTDSLLVADTLGTITLPVDTVHAGETPWQAAQHVLLGAPHGIPVLRRVVVDMKQTRRRKVITHVLATDLLSRETVASVTYRDPRAELRVLPTGSVLERNPKVQRRVLLALQALAVGETAYVEDGTVVDTPSEALRRLTMRT